MNVVGPQLNRTQMHGHQTLSLTGRGLEFQTARALALATSKENGW